MPGTGDSRLAFLSDVSLADETELTGRLTLTEIEIVAPSSAINSLAGQVLIYQTATLVSRLFDRVTLIGEEAAEAHPRFALVDGPFLSAMREEIANIRPEVPKSNAPGCALTRRIRVIVGRGEAGDETSQTIYVGANGWFAMLSATEPQDLHDSPTTVGALAAGTLAAAEVFKMVFGDVVPQSLPFIVGSREGYSLSLLTYGPADNLNPALPEEISIDLTLFGCGSIGCSIVNCLLLTPQLAGTVGLVDNGRFDERNPFKYVLLDWASAHAGKFKAVWAQRQLSERASDRYSARAFVGTAAEYVATLPVDYHLPLVASAVDTVEARLEIQDTLPRKIVNAGIEGTLAEVSVHSFGSGPCLACLGIRQARESWSAQTVADRVGLPAARVHELIITNSAMTADDVRMIREAGRAPASMIEDVASFVGQPVLSFYHRVMYSETAVTTPAGARARVTTAFVSAFAGILVLAECIKASVPDLQKFALDNSYRQELLGVPGEDRMRYERDTTGWCTCHSNFRQLVYMEKYGIGAGERVH